MSENGSFPPRPHWKRFVSQVTDEEVAAVIPHVSGYRYACRALGIGDGGKTATRLRARIEAMNLDVSHFVLDDNRAIRSEVLFSRREKKHSPAFIIKRAVSDGLLPNNCAECALPPLWRGKELLFRLEHLNGDVFDNRIENIRILCPNCHAQLPAPPTRYQKRRENLKMKKYKALLEQERIEQEARERQEQGVANA